jgi:L-iditol 2-dehydrogenase
MKWRQCAATLTKKAGNREWVTGNRTRKSEEQRRFQGFGFLYEPFQYPGPPIPYSLFPAFQIQGKKAEVFMQAVVFDVSIPKYALAKGLGRFSHEFFVGKLSGLSLRDIPRPTPPSPDWTRLKTVAAGVCGSDIGAIYLKSSPSLEPFNSFPCVLGHEILAKLEEKSADLEADTRVAVDTTLGCKVRQIETLCRGCQEGSSYACERVAEGCFAPGMTLGFHRNLPGGFCSELVAPRNQLFAVPESLPDHVAVLTEPLSIGVHGVLRAMPKDEDHVLVIGGGMIAFSAIWALRALGSRAKITQVALLPYQLEVGQSLGANDGFLGGSDEQFCEEVQKRTKARVYKPLIGPKVFAGGFDLVIDCIGSSESVRDTLRVTRGTGKVLLLGAAATLRGVDWSFVWSRELTVRGTVGYGKEEWRGRSMHTFELVLERLASGEAPDVSNLVTHRYSLSQYKEAIIANVERGKYRSVKTIFTFGPS